LSAFGKRVIPVLSIDDQCKLIKTVNFATRTYLGDPLNAVRIFNEFEVDELCLLDIDASFQRRQPNFEFIKKIASEAFMPLSYGGGINNLSQCEQLNKIGIDKFIIHSGLDNHEFLKEVIDRFGSQSLVACVDYSRSAKKIVTSKKIRNINPEEYCTQLQSLGVGEIILQSYEDDGSQKGYDLKMIHKISRSLSIPLIALGGAGSYKHLGQGIDRGASAVASASTFCFVGNLRGVLLNYPNHQELKRISNYE
jgi:cyclase